MLRKWELEGPGVGPLSQMNHVNMHHFMLIVLKTLHWH